MKAGIEWREWILRLVAALLGAASVFIVGSLDGCRSAVPVIVQTHNYQCQNAVENVDGTMTFTGCKQDGSIHAPATGGSGDDEIQVEPFDPQSFLKLDPPPRRVARLN